MLKEAVEYKFANFKTLVFHLIILKLRRSLENRILILLITITSLLLPSSLVSTLL